MWHVQEAKESHDNWSREDEGQSGGERKGLTGQDEKFRSYKTINEQFKM